MTEILYEASLQITGSTAFGVELPDVLAGTIPPQGARFDISFAGTVRGQVDGHLVGTDFLEVRADGRIDLNLRGVLTLDDGRTVAFSGIGSGVVSPDGPRLDFDECVRFSSAHEDLAWMNARFFHGGGSADLGAGTISVMVYAGA